MLVGQDKTALGALVVPNMESIKNWAQKQTLNYADASDIYHCPDVQKLFKKELAEHIKKRSNFRAFEKIQRFKLVEEPFSIENRLMTRTMKIKKAEVHKKYAQIIEEMFKS